MWGIIQKNGDYVIGLMLEENGSGKTKLFDTEVKAQAFAKENCAFEYSIVEI